VYGFGSFQEFLPCGRSQGTEYSRQNLSSVAPLRILCVLGKLLAVLDLGFDSALVSIFLMAVSITTVYALQVQQLQLLWRWKSSSGMNSHDSRQMYFH
jgi:hypothetical protein